MEEKDSNESNIKQIIGIPFHNYYINSMGFNNANCLEEADKWYIVLTQRWILTN